MATAILGSVQEFDEKLDTWSNYIDRAEQFFLANEIESEQKKKAILLSSVGPRTYKLICSLTQPDKPSAKCFDDIVEAVRNHHSPRPSIIVQRFKFNSYVRQPHQPIRNYIAELKKLSEFCNYGNNLNEMLRDRLVCGVNDRRIQTKLLAEKDLTFQRGLEIAQALELANENFNSLSVTEPDAINFVKRRPQTQNSNSRPAQHFSSKSTPSSSFSSSNNECFRCNGNHNPSSCKHKESKCFHCSKIGHLASACRKRQQSSNPTRHHQNNLLDTETLQWETETVDSDYELFGLLSLGSKTSAFKIKLNINGRDILFVFDTGASLTVINKTDYYAKLNTPIRKSSKTLTTFTGEHVKILGETTVKVSHGGSTKELELLVVDCAGPSLVGRDWMKLLNLQFNTVFNVDDSVTNNSEDELQQMLQQYASVFQDSPGCVTDIAVKLHVEPGTVPKFCRARTPPYALRQGIEEALHHLQRDNIIVPVEHSDWATPIVPVLKKDKTIRICGDYKTTLNAVAKTDNYPIPLVEDLAFNLAGGKKFTKIDFSHAYTQLELDEDSRSFTTINTHKGLFRYNRLCFGIAAAPGIFQRTMEGIFKNVPSTVNYLDDLYITGDNDRDHLNNLQQVLAICKDRGMTLKKNKCEFMREEVLFLGFRLNKHGLKPMEEKVQAVKKFDAPTDKHLLKSFLGLINYYGKFANNLATILAPLYRLLRKDVTWVWGNRESKAFDEAKSLLSSDMILAQYDPNRETIITCDASPVGVGAILSQIHGDGEHPVAFASRTLQDAERKYAQIDREALGIIFAVKKWHKFLSGRHFTIKTDHKPLLGLFGEGKRIPDHASARVQRWALILSGHSYSLEFKPGVNNEADILSRLPLSNQNKTEFVPAELEELFTLIEKTPISVDDIAKETKRDPILLEVYKKVLSGWGGTIAENLRPYAARKSELSIENGCLLWGVRVIIPQLLRKKILVVLHETHTGMARMKAQARSWVWWPCMDAEIEQQVKTCNICQVHSKTPPKAPLFPWEWPEKPWSRVHLDFAGPFLGKQFLIVVDAHSKWVDVKIMTKITAQDTILELRDVFSSLGLCTEIVTDNGPTFTSAEFRKFLGCNGIKHITVSPYHPSSNGLAERYVQEFKRHMTKNQNGSLKERVLKFLTKTRSLPHCTTGVSPFELMFGRKMKTHLDLMHPLLLDTVTDKQAVQKHYHDRHANFREMNVGDNVLVKNFSGRGEEWVPGTVDEKTGSYSYHVATPNGTWRRHIDHVRKSNADPLLDGDNQPMELTNTPLAPIESDQASTPVDPISVGTEPATACSIGPVVVDLVIPDPPILRRSVRSRKPVSRLDV